MGGVAITMWRREGGGINNNYLGEGGGMSQRGRPYVSHTYHHLGDLWRAE